MNELQRLLEKGESFREELSHLEGYGLTKWFDGLSKGAKHSTLAVIIATGASGCSTLSQNVLSMEPSAFESMEIEAERLNAMPRDQLLETILSRQHTDKFDQLERVSIPELASKIANAPDNKTPLDKPLALENPYVPGQLVQISKNTDLKANFDIGVRSGFGWRHMISAPMTNNPFAINMNNAQGETASFSSPSAPAYIIAPGEMSGSSWAMGNPDAQAERIAFTLYHEMGHNHMTQELLLHSGA